MLNVNQVQTYALLNSQGRYTRPGPVSQPQSSSWTLLLRASSDTRSAVAQEHLHRPKEGLSRLRSTAQEWRFVDAMGRSRRITVEYLFDGEGTRGEQPLWQRMGALHPESH